MYGDRSKPRENGTREQAAKPRRTDLLKIFISASPRGSSSHCKVGHFVVGKLIGVLSSLLASSPCMATEASCERTVRASKRQSRVGRIS